MSINSRIRPFLFLLIFFVSTQTIKAQTKVTSQPSKTSSGLHYKIYPGNGGEKPKPGEFVKFRMQYILEPQDSVLHSSFNTLPDYTPIDTSAKTRYSFMEVLPKMSAGDSAVSVVSVDTLVKRKMLPDYNENFRKGGSIKCEVKLLQVFKSDSAVQSDYSDEINIETNREIEDVKNYAAQQGLKGFTTDAGVFISLKEAGDTSVKAINGKTASIMYRGTLLNGKVFDTNMDSSKGHTDPITVEVGAGRVIRGWEDALPYFGVGTKGTIIVPAMLAYGPRPMGADIPAFSNLVFDIDVIDVK